MRLDIVTNDAGDLVRREHARDLGAGVVVALYRLLRQAQLHDLANQAFVRQLEQTHQIIGEYCLRAGTSVNVLFAQKAVFVAGQLLKGSRTTYEAAAELGEILERAGGSELSIAREVTPPELHAFAEAVANEKGRALRSPSPRIRLRAVGDAARVRGIDIESLSLEQKIVRNYATAVVVLRRFFDDLGASRYVLPRRIKRVAQNLVDLSSGATPSFLGVTAARNANHDAAGRAVNAAILAVAIAREVTSERATLAQIAMAAMMHDVGRPRALALAASGTARLSPIVARLAEDAEDKLPGGTAAVLTALGRVNEPSITRTVIAFESLWLRRAQSLGPVYRGARPPTLHARIVTVARRYNDLLTPEPGLAPPIADAAVARLASELSDPADRNVLRMLVSALGIFPVGTVVQLSSGEVGEVVPSNGAGDPGKPLVRVSMGADGGVLPMPLDVNLARAGETRRISRVMSVEGWKKGLDLARPPHAAADSSFPSRSAVVPTEPRVRIATPVPSPIVSVESPPTPRHVPTAQAAVTLIPPAREAAASELPRPPDDVAAAIPASAASTPSVVAKTMGRMIEEALRGSPAPSALDPSPPPIAEAAADPPPRPSAPPRASSPARAWRIGESSPPKPAADVSTLAEMKAARPVTPVPPAGTTHVPTARGTLGATPLAHVLVYMLDHALSGSIVFREPDELDHVLYFQLGAVSKVNIARPSSRLGDELVGSGLVARAAINEAVEGARRLGLLLGEYLVGHDIVTREALTKALENQIGSRVASIVNLPPETTYSFYRDVDLLRSIETDGVVSDPLNVILATVRAWHDRARIRATLSRIAKHPLLLHPQSDVTHLTLSAEERRVLDYVQEAKPPTAALFQRRIANDEAVSSLLYALAVTRQFAFKGQKGAPMGGRGTALPISIAPPSRAEAVSAVAPPSAPATRASAAEFGDADDFARASALPAAPPSSPSAAVGSGTERALEAMTHFRLAESALQRNDLAQAERLAARAVTGDPGQTDYVALHAWIRAMTSTKDDAVSEAIHTLSRLLADDAGSERALLYRGKLLKKANREREALRDFERLLQANPRHREATQEVRLLRQRAPK